MCTEGSKYCKYWYKDDVCNDERNVKLLYVICWGDWGDKVAFSWRNDDGYSEGIKRKECSSGI